MSLVNTWEEEIDGKKISFKDSFVDISPSSFTLVSEGLGDGTAVWRVTTKYTKQTTKQGISNKNGILTFGSAKQHDGFGT